MATLRAMANGNWQAIVRRKNITAYKTFPSKSRAQQWAAQLEREGTPEDGVLLSRIPLKLKLLLGRADYSPEDIVAAGMPVSRQTGVYFLIRDSEIIYVGKTTDLYNRLRRHVHDGRRFDHYNFLPCPPEQLNELEAAYIARILPRENRVMNL